METAASILAGLVSNHPIVMSVVTVVGCLRLVVKPTITVLHVIAGQTATKADDEALARLENSRLYASFLFLLDWLASIKKSA